ncbi:MAG: protein kinase [Nonomuraea sp.]|nr:protein kinase [Nonomuraea sp.]
MPRITGLRTGDPAEVGGCRLVGRLGSGLYVGQERAGEQVAVRLLPEGTDAALFLAAIEPLRQVDAAGAARVLDTGTLGERAYVVSEYVDGPALSEAPVPFDAVTLYRLAVGTITALVAIHQAGHVHGDLSPAAVVLGPDGPRLVDLGLEQARTQAAIVTRRVTVPAYTAPERLRGSAAGSAADVFSWAATMAYAATGAPPFGDAPMATTVERILKDAPDLGDLGELHSVIAACLDKDPQARPSASDVLLRLVGQTSFLTGRQEPVPVVPPPARRPMLPALAAAFLAGALVSGVAVYAVQQARTPGKPVATAPTPSATPSATPSRTVAEVATVEKKAEKDLPLPVVGITLHEHSKDPVNLRAYLEVAGKYTSYVRDRTGAFKAVGVGEEPILAPGGDWVALNPWLKFQDSDMDQIKFLRLSTGETFTVATVKKPLQTMFPGWSRDGTKLVLAVTDDGKVRKSNGFVLVDLATRKATQVETEFVDDGSLLFTFTPDGTIARGYGDGERHGIDFYDLAGKVIKSMNWVGLPRDRDWFSPSGKQLVTVCPGRTKEVCVRDAVTGTRRVTVPRPDDRGDLLGWFNESHLMLREPGKKKGSSEIRLVDLAGKTVRVLADVTPLKSALQFAPVAR